jgi:hypothetical protein
MKTLACFVFLCFPLTIAQAAIVTFSPTQDTFMRGAISENQLNGAKPNGRASKTGIDFYLTDFDRQAIITRIESELGHPFSFADMADIEISWSLFSNDFQEYQPTALSRPAVFQGQQPWFEGNALGGATKAYALYDPANPANNLPWRKRDGSTVTDFFRLDKVENAVFEEWGGAAYTWRKWVLDDFVAYTYLTDPLSLGLFLNASDLAVGTLDAKYSNTEVYSKETGDPTRRPFLELIVVPEPASVGLLGFGVLVAGFRRRRIS